MNAASMDQVQIAKFISDLDRNFYADFDPFFFWVASEVTRTGKIPTVKLELPDGSELSGHPFLENLETSRKKITETQNSLLRMYRYFAAETMLILLLSSKPHDPAYRVTSVLRGGDLTEVFKEIGGGSIPARFQMAINDKLPTFDEWLGQKVASDPTFFMHQDTASIGDFIRGEATFASERGAINSFKHSRPVTYGPSIRVNLTLGGQKTPIDTIQFTGVNWVEWKEKGSWFYIRHESEEVDIENDPRAIFYSCLVMDLMKRIRLRQIGGHEGEISLSIPCKFEPIPPVRRQNFTIKFSAKESERRPS